MFNYLFLQYATYTNRTQNNNHAITSSTSVKVTPETAEIKLLKRKKKKKKKKITELGYLSDFCYISLFHVKPNPNLLPSVLKLYMFIIHSVPS